MNLSRRQFLHLAACAARKGANHPTRSVRKIVPFPAGGSTDVLARLMVSGSPYAFFNFTRDTVPVAGVMNRFHVMVVRH